MEILLSVLKILLSVYVIFALLLYFFQRKMLYFPQSSLKNVDAEEIEFTNQNIVLKGWIVNKGNKKAILYYGGNAEMIESNVAFYKENFPEYTLYLINYRGFGSSEGDPSEKNFFDDALFIYDKISSQHEDISLIGRSLGTGVATYIATKRKIGRLVLITPFDSILNVAKSTFWMFPLSILLKDKYESIRYVKNVEVRTLIFIAEIDHIIPLQSSNNLADGFNKTIAQVEIIEGSGHNNISIFEKFRNTLKVFFREEKKEIANDNE